MDQNKKIPIKVAEISINKFNDQIYQKVQQLRKFRISNATSTASTLGDMGKLRKEAINSLRVVKQLKQLLLEINVLRSKTLEEDHAKFDELIAKRKKEALKEIEMVQDMKPLEKLNELSPSATSTVDNESPSTVRMNTDLMKVQLLVDDREIRSRELDSKQALLREVENLQTECEEVSQLYQNVHGLVTEQAASVDAIAENVDVAEIHVEEGTRHLRQALTYKTTVYPLLGGFIGACMLGPVGFVAGLKAGGAASVFGAIGGYAGGKFLKKANEPETEDHATIQNMEKESQSDDVAK